MIMLSAMPAPSDKSVVPLEMPLAIVWRRIEELQGEPKSTRPCSPEQIRQVAKSIAAFGFSVPILVGPGSRIIAGYIRLLAARQLGWSEVPTIPLHHLSPAQAHVFITADDRLAEAGSWNDLLLAMRLKEVSPLAGPDFGGPCRHPSRRRRTTCRTAIPAELVPTPPRSRTRRKREPQAFS